MSDSGFDWFNMRPTPPDSDNLSPTATPPPVSFGFGAKPALPKRLNNSTSSIASNNLHPKANYFYGNSSADHLPVHLQISASENGSNGNLSNGKNSVVSSGGDDDLSIPLSLTAQELTLDESKTYMRWYSDILARTNSRTITMSDVFHFLNNFKISNAVKDQLNRIFHKILSSINIGEFFALLRLVSHTLNGLTPSRKLIKVQAPVPTPPSILSKKRQNDDNDDDYNNDYDNENNNSNLDTPSSSQISNNESNLSINGTDGQKPLDLDSFTQFMLTGQRPGDVVAPKKKRSKKLKSVKFSDQVVTDIHSIDAKSPTPSPDTQQLDYSLPMDQLMRRLSQTNTNLRVPPQGNYRVASPDEEEKEILKDMESQINHFQHLNSVDTASINGVPSQIHVHRHHQPNDQETNNHDLFLRPNMTGPAQMSQMFTPSPPSLEEQEKQTYLKPNMTGPAQMLQYYNSSHNQPNIDSINDNNEEPTPIRPNVTGPIDMAKIFSPSYEPVAATPEVSLLSFSEQMTGLTLNNTLMNSRTDNASPMRKNGDRPLPPPPVPSTRRSRSVSLPTLTVSPPLEEPRLSVPRPPVPPRSPSNSTYNRPLSPLSYEKPGPPPPPPVRRRGASTSGTTSVPTSFSGPSGPSASSGTLSMPSSISGPSAPALPPKVAIGEEANSHSNNPYTNNINNSNNPYSPTKSNNPYSSPNPSNPYNNSNNGSTANILDDLKALQEEVDRIRDMTGGF